MLGPLSWAQAVPHRLRRQRGFLILTQLIISGDWPSQTVKLGLFLASLGAIAIAVGAFLKFQAKEEDGAAPSGPPTRSRSEPPLDRMKARFGGPSSRFHRLADLRSGMADDFPELHPCRRRSPSARCEASRPNPLTPPPPEPPPVEPVVKRGVLDWVGPRAARRPEPRLGVSVSAAGAGMLVVGAIALGGDQLFGTSSGDGSQFPGLLITFAVIVAGVALTAHYRNGPLAAAGVAASATALPPFLVFLTYSKGSAPSFDTILLVSCIGWAAGYLVGPAEATRSTSAPRCSACGCGSSR